MLNEDVNNKEVGCRIYMETVLSLQLYYTYKTTQIKSLSKWEKTSPEDSQSNKTCARYQKHHSGLYSLWLVKTGLWKLSRWLFFSCHCTSQVAFPVFCCSSAQNSEKDSFIISQSRTQLKSKHLEDQMGQESYQPKLIIIIISLRPLRQGAAVNLHLVALTGKLERNTFSSGILFFKRTSCFLNPESDLKT